MNIRPSFGLSLIPIIILVLLLSFNVVVFGDGATSGPNQLALLFSAIVAALIARFKLKHDYHQIEKEALKSIGIAMQANIILLVVGTLIALWILSGVVPTMIYYGVTMVNPTLFLPVSCVICAIVSVATGSSWSTGGTVGIALIGIGQALNIPTEMVAGAVISGAYFGDKLSPLSDTTNLAPAISGATLFDHVKHMIYTVTPSMVIALIGFTILGFSFQGSTAEFTTIIELKRIIAENFYVGLPLMIVPAVVIVMVARKVPALPALLFGCFLAVIAAVLFQRDLFLAKLGGDFSWVGVYKIIIETSYGGFSIESGNKIIDSLFSRGGMSGMLNTVWLIMMAMLFGGIMEGTGMLQTLANAILKMVSGVASLVGSTLATALVLNVTASDQYLAIVVTAKMFKDAYQNFGLRPKNLSRAVEDGATVTSVLIPWNTCGAYFSSVLGVSTLAYLPYCFFNLVSPFTSFVVAASGWSMEKIDTDDEDSNANNISNLKQV